MVGSKSKEPRIESFAMDRPQVSWNPGLDGWDAGSIMFPDGETVLVYMQGDERRHHMTRLDFVLDGRHYIVSTKKRYTRRGVVGFARKMLAEAGIPN